MLHFCSTTHNAPEDVQNVDGFLHLRNTPQHWLAQNLLDIREVDGDGDDVLACVRSQKVLECVLAPMLSNASSRLLLLLNGPTDLVRHKMLRHNEPVDQPAIRKGEKRVREPMCVHSGGMG